MVAASGDASAAVGVAYTFLLIALIVAVALAVTLRRRDRPNDDDEPERKVRRHDVEQGLSDDKSPAPARPMTLVIRCARTSNEENDGVAQAVDLTSAFQIICNNSVNPDQFQLHPTIFIGIGIDRREAHRSPGLPQMYELLEQLPPWVHALVLFPDVLRIGLYPDCVQFVEDTVAAFHPNSRVETVNEWGMPNFPVAELNLALISGNAAISTDFASQNDAGKNVPVDPNSLGERSEVKRLAKEFYQRLMSDDDNALNDIVKDGLARGQALAGNSEFRKKWITAQAGIEKDVSLVQEEADALIALAAAGDEMPLDLKWLILIYLRVSPWGYILNRIFIDGVPLHQIAWNLALAQMRHGPNFGDNLVILADIKCHRHNRGNPKLCLAAQLIAKNDPRVDSFIASAPSRVSTHVSSHQLLGAVAGEEDSTGTAIEYSYHLGQDSLKIAGIDSKRLSKKSTVLDVHTRGLEEARAQLDEPTEEISRKLHALRRTQLSAQEHLEYSQLFQIPDAPEECEYDSDDECCAACQPGDVV